MTPTVETGLVRKPSWNATPLWSLPLCEHNGIHSHHHTYYERKHAEVLLIPPACFPDGVPAACFFSSKNGQASSAAAVLASAIVRSEKTHTLACNEFQMLICLQPQVVKAIYDTKSCISQHHCITLEKQRDIEWTSLIESNLVDMSIHIAIIHVEAHKTLGTVVLKDTKLLELLPMNVR